MACCDQGEGEGEERSVGQTLVGVVGQQWEPLGWEGWLDGVEVGVGLPHGSWLGLLKEVEGLHHEMGVREQPGSGLAGAGVLWIHLKE